MVINVLGTTLFSIKRHAKKVAINTLQYLNCNNAEITIKFVNATEIQNLNNTFRNINKVTDVLSFPATNIKAGEQPDDTQNYLGDMAICVSRAREQSKQYGNTLKQEVQKLVIHSILHLLGYDHILDEDYLVMNQKEQQIENYLNKGE